MCILMGREPEGCVSCRMHCFVRFSLCFPLCRHLRSHRARDLGRFSPKIQETRCPGDWAGWREAVSAFGAVRCPYSPPPISNTQGWNQTSQKHCLVVLTGATWLSVILCDHTAGSHTGAVKVNTFIMQTKLGEIRVQKPEVKVFKSNIVTAHHVSGGLLSVTQC